MVSVPKVGGLSRAQNTRETSNSTWTADLSQEITF